LSPTHRVLARPEVNVLGLTIAEQRDILTP